MWQRRRGYFPATAGTLGTAAATAELDNSGHKGGGSNTEDSGDGGSGSFRAR